MIKILYFDTNAIIKYFCKEKGSDLIKWVVNNRVEHSLHLNTSQIAIYEFKKVIKKKAIIGDISHERMRSILSRSKHYFPNIFHVRDYRCKPYFRSLRNTTHIEICNNYNLRPKKNDWDARHLAFVVNYLSCFGGCSRPRILSSDIHFKKLFKKMDEMRGFDLIDPENISKEQFLQILKS